MNASPTPPLSTRAAAEIVGYSPGAVLLRCQLVEGVARRVPAGSRFVFDIDLEALRASLDGVKRRARRKPTLPCQTAGEGGEDARR